MSVFEPAILITCPHGVLKEEIRKDEYLTLIGPNGKRNELWVLPFKASAKCGLWSFPWNPEVDLARVLFTWPVLN